MHPEAVLAPAGILEVDNDQLNIIFGTSRDTSDFVADCLELWWTNRQFRSSWRTSVVDRSGQRPGDRQFPDPVHETLGRVLGPVSTDVGIGVLPSLSQQVQPHRAVLGYPRESLERDTIDLHPDALEWAKTMTWRGVAPIVHLMDRVYETGVRLLPRDFRPIAAHLESINIPPEMEPHHQSRIPVDYFLRAA